MPMQQNTQTIEISRDRLAPKASERPTRTFCAPAAAGDPNPRENRRNINIESEACMPFSVNGRIEAVWPRAQVSNLGGPTSSTHGLWCLSTRPLSASVSLHAAVRRVSSRPDLRCVSLCLKTACLSSHAVIRHVSHCTPSYGVPPFARRQTACLPLHALSRLALDVLKYLHGEQLFARLQNGFPNQVAAQRA